MWACVWKEGETTLAGPSSIGPQMKVSAAACTSLAQVLITNEVVPIRLGPHLRSKTLLLRPLMSIVASCLLKQNAAVASATFHCKLVAGIILDPLQAVHTCLQLQ